jgi:hypothetical protein
MRCDDKGLSLNKRELNALLRFCDDDPESSLDFVQFKIDEKFCEAYATNGFASVRAAGPSVSDERIGEWFVHRDFIALCARTLESDQVLVLAFSGASISEATIMKDGEEVGNVGWPRDAAIAQSSIKFPDIATHIPKGSPKDGCGLLAAGGSYLALLAKVEQAADCTGVELFIPSDPDKPIKCRVGAHKDTVWTVVICTMRLADLGKELESEQEERRTKRGSKKQPSLPGTEDDVDAAVAEAGSKFRSSMQDIADDAGADISFTSSVGGKKVGKSVTFKSRTKATKKKAGKRSKR